MSAVTSALSSNGNAPWRATDVKGHASESQHFRSFAPSGAPTEVISKLNTAVVEALADPAVRTRLADLGADIFPREQQTLEALRALQKASAEKWWPIIKELGIKAE